MLVKCNQEDCNRQFEAPEGQKHCFCSIECACYSGWYSIKTGWRTEEEHDAELARREKEFEETMEKLNDNS